MGVVQMTREMCAFLLTVSVKNTIFTEFHKNAGFCFTLSELCNLHTHYTTVSQGRDLYPQQNVSHDGLTWGKHLSLSFERLLLAPSADYLMLTHIATLAQNALWYGKT